MALICKYEEKAMANRRRNKISINNENEK